MAYLVRWDKAAWVHISGLAAVVAKTVTNAVKELQIGCWNSERYEVRNDLHDLGTKLKSIERAELLVGTGHGLAVSCGQISLAAPGLLAHVPDSRASHVLPSLTERPPNGWVVHLSRDSQSLRLSDKIGRLVGVVLRGSQDGLLFRLPLLGKKLLLALGQVI